MRQPPTTMAMIATLLAAPAIVTAIGLTAIEGYRLVRPEAPLFGGEPPSTLAEAITGGHGVEQAYAFIRAGQDPNAEMTVNHPDYTDGRTVSVSPLMLAVAARDSNTAVMLLSFGAHLDLPQNRHARCLAQELGNEEILGILSRDRDDAPATCLEQRSGAATPLLTWID